MWKTNLEADGKPLETKDVTLLHFTNLTKVGKNNAEHAKIMAAHDTGRAPTPKGKNDKPRNQSFDVSASLRDQQVR